LDPLSIPLSLSGYLARVNGNFCDLAAGWPHLARTASDGIAGVESNPKWNLLLAMVDSRKVARSGSHAVHAVTSSLRETRFEEGLIVVPGFADGELLRPSACCFSERGKIKSIGGMENLFGK